MESQQQHRDKIWMRMKDLVGKDGYLPYEKWKIYEWIETKGFPHYKGMTKRGYLFKKDEVDAWMKQFKTCLPLKVILPEITP